MSSPYNTRSVKHKPSAIVTQAQLDASRPHFERAVALLLLALSIAGSVIAFCGGWDRLKAGEWGWASFVIGVGVQLLCIAVSRNARF